MTKGLSSRLPIPDNPNTRKVLGRFIRETLNSSLLQDVPPYGYTVIEWKRTLKVLEAIDTSLNLT